MSYRDPLLQPRAGDVFYGYFDFPWRDAFKPRQESEGDWRTRWEVVEATRDEVSYKGSDWPGSHIYKVGINNFLHILMGADARGLVNDKENEK